MGLTPSHRMIVAAAVVAAIGAPAAARGDAVTDWNAYANAAIFSTVPPPTAHAAVLSTAMVQDSRRVPPVGSAASAAHWRRCSQRALRSAVSRS